MVVWSFELLANGLYASSRAHSVGSTPAKCYTFPLESEVLRIVPIERIYKAPKYILVLVVTKYKQGCGVYSLRWFGLIDLIRLA